MSQDSCCSPKSEKAPNSKNEDSKLSAEGEKTTVFKVSGMDCSDEIASIENTVEGPEIFGVDANLMKETVTIIHGEGISLSELKALVEKSGVKVVGESRASFTKQTSHE